MSLEILCAGIGGRGVLLASTIIIEAAVALGRHAIASDEYGMSQRGGSVVSLIKIGDVESPLIGRENADILLAFEESEFYRNLRYLKRGGLAIVNSTAKNLPEGVAALLGERETRWYIVDADGMAKQAGMTQAANMAVLGFLSSVARDLLGVEDIEATIRTKTAQKVREKNVEVFYAGYRDGQSRT
jgi:indolepyruvate ferredoxin oxidoreductase, beta subunit